MYVGSRENNIDVCDHRPIFATLVYPVSKLKAYKRMLWNYKGGSYDIFRHSLLNASWPSCYVKDDVDTTVQNWIDLFLNCAEQCVEHYEATIRPRDKHFMNSKLRTLLRKRDRLCKKLKQTQ